MLPCLNKKLFGFDCPGCGGQRALVLLFKGELTEAFFMYPAIYPLAILGLTLFINLFFPIKNYTKILNITGTISVATILTSYTIKMLF